MPPADQTAPPSGSGRRNLILAAGAAVLVVAAIVVASLVFRGGDDEATETTGTGTTPGEIGALFEGIPQDRAVLGSPDATVTMIQFEDLQCPVCKRYQEEGFPGIVEEYVRPGKVKLRFVGLAFIGPDSEKALLHSLAAGEQGKLWQFADELYANQGAENSGWVTDELLERLAGELGLDWETLQADADGDVGDVVVGVAESESSPPRSRSDAATRTTITIAAPPAAMSMPRLRGPVPDGGFERGLDATASVCLRPQAGCARTVRGRASTGRRRRGAGVRPPRMPRTRRSSSCPRAPAPAASCRTSLACRCPRWLW
jgi:protein-disulfide isomerase